MGYKDLSVRLIQFENENEKGQIDLKSDFRMIGSELYLKSESSKKKLSSSILVNSD